MGIGNTANRREVKILLCLIVISPFLLTPWVHGDGIGHFGFLRSSVIDRDLDLANEHDYLTTHIEDDAGGLPGYLLAYSDHQPGFHAGYHTPEPDPVTGRVPSNWSVGPAVLWAPAYLVAHGAVRLANVIGADHRSDGYGGLYYLAMALTTLACGIVGLLFAYRLAGCVAPSREAFWATLTIAVSSSLFYYLYLAPSHSHALTPLTAGAFLIYWHKNRHSSRARIWFNWGLLAGMLFLVRWNDIVIAIPIFAVESVRLLRRPHPSDSGGNVRNWVGCMAAALVGLFLVASIQLGVWQFLHGRPWVRHSVDTLQFNPTGLWGTLFSYRHGLFTWTPVTILSVVGLIRLFRRDAELAGVSLGVLAALVISNCAVYDWWAGSAFGMRRLVSATPVFVLGLAVFLDDVRILWARRTALAGRFLAPLVLVVFGVWNVLLVAQYSLGMISHVDAVPLSTIAANQPKVIIRLIDLLKGILS